MVTDLLSGKTELHLKLNFDLFFLCQYTRMQIMFHIYLTQTEATEAFDITEISGGLQEKSSSII